MSKLARMNIEVRKSDIHGWGVFACQDIYPGSLIEQCNFLSGDFSSANLIEYTFYLPKGDEESPSVKMSALALGFGSIYNHSNSNNASFILDKQKQIISFYASRLIVRGEEIFVNYGEGWSENKNVELIEPAFAIRSSLNYRMKKLLFDYRRIIRMTFGSAAIMASIAFLHAYHFAL